jgi:NAD(P)-dependent dehydrogenase (short-subunit alcohol dehydrogenase family)
MAIFQPLNPPIPTFARLRVWVVGASTGIGAATARQLIAQGAQVAVSARNGPLLEADFGTSTLVLPVDVTDARATQLAAESLVAAWGGVDLVLAVAGTYKAMRAWDIDLTEAGRIVDVNLTGVLNLFAAVQPVLMKQGAGGFGIVASVAGYGGLPNSLAYGASKAACINLAETLYLDLHKRGLAIYLITPGFVETPLTAKNAFPMPFLISAEKAAALILEGLAGGDFEIHFPRTFSRLLKAINLLPYRLYFWCVRRFTGL